MGRWAISLKQRTKNQIRFYKLTLYTSNRAAKILKIADGVVVTKQYTGCIKKR